MKISIVSNSSHIVPPTDWGGEIVLWDLYECLKKLGHNVSLFAPEGSKTEYTFPLNEVNIEAIEYDIYNKYNHILQSSDIVHDMSHMKMVSDMLFDDGFRNFINVLIGYYWKYPKCGKNVSTPSQIMRLHGMLGYNGFEYSPWENVMGKDVGKLNDAKAVLFGTNTDFYTPQYDKQNYFLWLNGFTDWKGLGLAIHLAKELKFNLIISGSVDKNHEQQETFKYYMNIIKDIKNIQYVPLPQNKEHHYVKRDLMQNAKALLFPILRDEGFGLVNIEALSCGTPIISTGRGAMPEIVKHGETGFICNTLDDFQYAMNNINNIDARTCRKDAVERFDRMVMAKNYVKLYEKIVNGDSW